MSLDAANRIEMVRLQMDRARRNIKQADEMIEIGYYDLAANRYYYACFHALQALLIGNGLYCHTHAGTIASFGKNFIKTGKIDEKYGRFVSKLEQLREKSDYNCAYNIEEEEVAKMKEPSHELIDIIASFLAVEPMP